MNISYIRAKQVTSIIRWLSPALLLVAVSISDLHASNDRKMDISWSAACPCAYDEPFASVLSQIKKNPYAWSIGTVGQPVDSSAGAWQDYQLLRHGQKRHTLRLKLTGDHNTAHLSCSWIQWSGDHSINNEIGMGHYLYRNIAQGDGARKDCISKFATHVNNVVAPFRTQVQYIEPLMSIR